MATVYLLDAGPLGQLAHRRPTIHAPIRAWLLQEKAVGAIFYISEVADYEVRRELTRLIKIGQMPASRLQRLDQLTTICTYLPVSTKMWNHAAEFWADARSQGLPTASPEALDADALIAAQAAEVGATVVTNNPVHISRWVPVLTLP